MIEGTTSPPPPNKPISGKEPEFSFNEATEIASFKNGKYVDNSFAAPGANGCVLTLFGFIPISINGLVNSTAGLRPRLGATKRFRTSTSKSHPRAGSTPRGPRRSVHEAGRGLWSRPAAGGSDPQDRIV